MSTSLTLGEAQFYVIALQDSGEVSGEGEKGCDESQQEQRAIRQRFAGGMKVDHRTRHRLAKRVTGRFVGEDKCSSHDDG